MKTKFWIILIAAIFVLCVGASIVLFLPGADAERAEIWSGGKLICTVTLMEDRTFDVPTPNGEGSNTVTVEDGAISITAATCPDHYCMRRGACKGGADIVCLPNKLIIKFVTEAELDAVTG